MKYKISHLTTNMSIRRTSNSGQTLYEQQQKQQQQQQSPEFPQKQPKQALRAIELPGGTNLEM